MRERKVIIQIQELADETWDESYPGLGKLFLLFPLYRCQENVRGVWSWSSHLSTPGSRLKNQSDTTLIMSHWTIASKHLLSHYLRKTPFSVFELLSVGFSVSCSKYSLSVANIHFMRISLTDLHRLFSELFSTSSLNPEQAELLRQSKKKKRSGMEIMHSHYRSWKKRKEKDKNIKH